MTIKIKSIENLKEILVSSVHCRVDKECILESKFGKAVFEIKEEIQPKSIWVHAKRLSGNGVFLINGQPFLAASKICNSVEISGKHQRLEIIRPENSTGEISILGLDLHFDQEVSVAEDWKKTIAKCGSYHGIRLIGTRLFASYGAYIQNGLVVKEIETSPPNSSVLKDGQWKFNSSCEIIKLITDDNFQTDDTAFVVALPGMQAVGMPPVVPVGETTTASPNQLDSSRASIKPSFNWVNHNDGKQLSQVLYDSQSCQEFNPLKAPSTKLIKFIKSNGVDYLLLKRGGWYNIPASFIKPNMSYIVTITGKRLNGNGKINVELSHGSVEQVVINNSISETQIHLKSASNINAADEIFIKIMMSESSVGEILISRVRVIEGLKHGRLPESIRPVLNGWNPGYNSFFDTDIEPGKKKFVIVIPSYKNSDWCERNIQSTIDQNYQNYRVIFIDDCSPDDTFEKVSSVVNNSEKQDRFTLIKNKERQGALSNLYHAIHSCDDDEIIATLDGDDWLAHSEVLNRLNEIYSSGDVWMTYGQYQNFPDGGVGISQQIPAHIIQSNGYRHYTWCSSHLRTCYAWLFKQIREADCKYDGKFAQTAWDCTMQFPMLEMAAERAKFISDILYIYNLNNPINDHKVDRDFQKRLELHFRAAPKYSRLTQAVCKPRPTRVGLMMIATGKYHQFIQNLINSADEYFLNEPGIEVTYYVFTDRENQINTNRNVVQINIPHRPFPYASMDRFKHFTEHKGKMNKQDFLYYVDVDCLWTAPVTPTEIFGDLVGVQHCGYYGISGPWESNPKSCLYIDGNYHRQYSKYYGGGFNGGKRSSFLRLAEWCYQQTEKDLSNDVVPIHHDETVLNRYFLDNEPEIMLTPSFHYPQDQVAHYRQIWGGQDFPKKLLLLTKNHAEVRG